MPRCGNIAFLTKWHWAATFAKRVWLAVKVANFQKVGNLQKPTLKTAPNVPKPSIKKSCLHNLIYTLLKISGSFYRNNREKSERYAEASKNDAEVPKNYGEASKNNGEVSKNHGEASKNDGEVSKNDGEASKNDGEVSKNDAEAPKNYGEAPKIYGELGCNDGGKGWK